MGYSCIQSAILGYLENNILCLCKKGSPGVEIVILKMGFESRRDAAGALVSPG